MIPGQFRGMTSHGRPPVPVLSVTLKRRVYAIQKMYITYVFEKWVFNKGPHLRRGRMAGEATGSLGTRGQDAPCPSAKAS